MGIGDDLTVFYRLKSEGGFADLATITPRSGAASYDIPVIFNFFNLSSNPYRGEVRKVKKDMEERFSCECRDSDALILEVGDGIQIDSVDYEIAGIPATSLGQTRLNLELLA